MNCWNKFNNFAFDMIQALEWLILAWTPMSYQKISKCAICKTSLYHNLCILLHTDRLKSAPCTSAVLQNRVLVPSPLSILLQASTRAHISTQCWDACSL